MNDRRVLEIPTSVMEKEDGSSVTVKDAKARRMLGRKPEINDTAPSATSVYSSEKVESIKALYLTSVACSAMTGDFASVSSDAITADHVVIECIFASPGAIKSWVTWTTAAGSLVLNGTCSAATTADIVLVVKHN